MLHSVALKQCAVNAKPHCGSKYGLRASYLSLCRVRCNSVHEVPTNNLLTAVTTAHVQQCYCWGVSELCLSVTTESASYVLGKYGTLDITEHRLAVSSLCGISTRQVQQQDVQDFKSPLRRK